MAETVYALCGLTSVGCAVLLTRAYRRVRRRLLFWSALCFSGLALNNVLLFIDLALIPKANLSIARAFLALGSVSVFVLGLVRESSCDR